MEVLDIDIYFSNLDKSELYQLPVLPETMPELSVSAKNEEFNGADGKTYTLMGGSNLVSFSIDCFLPPENAGFRGYTIKSNVNPYLIINLWRNSQVNKTPIRCVQTRNDGSEILNWMVTVESLSWYERGNGDIKYKVDFKEYNDPNPEA